MAIFERKIKQKPILDDTQSLICTIETAQKVNGHTVRMRMFYSKQSTIERTVHTENLSSFQANTNN